MRATFGSSCFDVWEPGVPGLEGVFDLINLWDVVVDDN